MAVGDVVGSISAANTLLTFQPAAGVEVCITCMTTNNSVLTLGQLTDGVLDSFLKWATNSVIDSNNMKVFVTNDLFIQIPAIAAGESSAFTGITVG